MHFALPPDIEATRARIREFVDTRIIPREADRASYDEHENIAPALLARLRAEARAAGLWCLSAPKDRGGQGFSMVGLAAVRRGPRFAHSHPDRKPPIRPPIFRRLSRRFH